jgi:acyl-CoA synthetase (AMP-forming)/AMP-acid ligase II
MGRSFDPVGRTSNMIIGGGSNIYPSEVENVLGGHPAVKDVAVIGMPDDQWGEAVHAVIVRHDGVLATESEILGWCEGRIADYKLPRSIAFIDQTDMPRTAAGKILHRTQRAARARDTASP